MKNQQVWREMHKSLMSPNQRHLKIKWVFKIKHNCVCWVHLVAWGHSQVPGVDLSKTTH